MTDKVSSKPSPAQRWLGHSGALSSGPVSRRKQKWEHCHRVRLTVFILAAIVLLGGGSLFAAQNIELPSAEKPHLEKSGSDSRPARYRVFSLRHIPAQKGKQLLDAAQIGTVSQLPGANMLLVTAQPGELTKASAILKLIDGKQEFVFKMILPASSVENMPSKEQIEAKVGDISIGTFLDPPLAGAQAKAIIDIHNNAVVAVASTNQIERIVSAVKELQAGGGAEALRPVGPAALAGRGPAGESKGEPITEVMLREPQKAAVSGEPASPADANEAGPDALFNGLLESLAEAEKRAAKGAGEPIESKSHDTAETPEQTKAPGTPPAGEVRAVGTEQPDELDLTAILRRLEAGIKEGLEVGRELPTEKVVKIESPNEVAELPTEKVVKIESPNEVAEPPIEQVVVKIEPPNEVTEAVAKVQYEPQALPNGDDVVNLDLPEKLPIVDFLNFVGKNLQLDYLYDPAQVKGEVTLTINGDLRGPVKVKDLYPMLESVMHFAGYVMTRKFNLVTIRPITDATVIDPPFVGPGAEKVEHGDVVITRVFELAHIDTASAENLLKGMQLGVKVTPIPGTGTLIVTEYAYRMGRVEELLNMVDKPGDPKEFRFRQLKFTMADTLAPKLKSLVEQLGTISVTVAAPSPVPGRAQPPRTQRPPPRRGARPLPTPAPTSQPQTPAPTPSQPTIYLEADTRTNRILMIGYEEELAIVEDLIDTLDVEQQDLRTLHLYMIENVDAEEVKNKLAELGIISGDRTTQRKPGRSAQAPARTAPEGQPPQRITPTAGAAPETVEEALAGEPQVVIIETTNSLLVNATPEQHAQIQIIIGFVDSQPEETDTRYVVYPLENQDPEELANVLLQLISETTTKEDKTGKIEKTTQKKIEEDITIIPDKGTFSLIVYATRKNQQWIESLIRQLDKRRPQVLIDVTLVQITKDEAFSMDLDLLSAIPDMGYVSGETPVTSKIFDLLTKPESDRGKFIELASLPVGSGLQGFYGDKKINALLTAIQTKAYGRVMARPKLLVNDNEMGTIQSVDTTYVQRTSTSVIGTDNPQTTESTVFDDYSAGITLQITPHISEGQMLRLEVTLNRSGFTSALGGDIPPDKTDSDITTIVTVPDKSTIILGGLEQVQNTKGGQKIPILGDLPFIGGLFRSVSREDRQDKTYVFVKAHILRPGADATLDDLKEISHRDRAAFERLETEMGVYKDWPGLKPRPLDPLQILELD